MLWNTYILVNSKKEKRNSFAVHIEAASREEFERIISQDPNLSKSNRLRDVIFRLFSLLTGGIVHRFL